MTATPQPAPVPDAPKDWLASEIERILTLRYGEAEDALVTALVLVASQFAASRVEEFARPDNRWRPK